MTMKKMTKYDRRKQRGVALLFALGILALLLILGLASVANALMAQKVANNNSSRSQAKMIAQSAISRVAVSLMYYQESAKNITAPTNYLSIYSKNNGVGASDDGLRNLEESGLLPPDWRDYVEIKKTIESGDEWTLGEWSYVTEGSGSNLKIVGRVAYQVLPTSFTQINLFHLLRGVYPTGGDSPWKVRLGNDINELNQNDTIVFEDWENEMSSIPEATFVTNVKDTTLDQFVAANITRFQGTLPYDDAVRTKWLSRWFSASDLTKEPTMDPEQYVYMQTGATTEKNYHRFFLGVDSTVPWYDRLKTHDGSAWNTVAANSDDAVKALAADSVEFLLNDTKTADGVGLPFLKFIANDKGSFADLATRRKQIAANLNDYCDFETNPVPTSDVAADTWKDILATSADWPTYTGNEETPYINELALGFRITPSITTPASGDFMSHDVAVKVAVDEVELIAELIQIYNSTPTTDYKLQALLKSLALRFKVSIKGELSYLDSNSATVPLPPFTDEMTMTVAEALSFNADRPAVVDFSVTSPSWNSGYLVHASENLATDPANWATGHEFTFDFSPKFKEVLNNLGAISSATITEIKVEVIEPQFELGGIALTDLSGVGLDFVRWDSAGGSKLPRPQVETGRNNELALFSQWAVASSGYIKKADVGHADLPQYARFYIGGMEAKDPRQNLNANPDSGSTEAEKKKNTDWSLFTNIALVDFDNPGNRISIEIEPTGTSTAARLKKGIVNSDACPKKETSPGVFDPNYDVEQAKDPAWVSVAEDEHLSTAYIRNAPMKSLWELGAIHRGAAWETINLKNAMRPGSDTEVIGKDDMEQPGDSWDTGNGTSYSGGDGGLLEQVKMTNKAYTFGKLNVNMLSSNKVINPEYVELDDEMGRTLFFNVRLGELLHNFDGKTGTAIPWGTASPVSTTTTGTTDVVPMSLKRCLGAIQENRAQFLARKDGDNSLANGFGIIAPVDYKAKPDAQQEELIGKTINLLKTSATASTMVKVVVVAQTIKDLGGPNGGTKIPVVRLKYDGTVETQDCERGVFDMKADGSTFPSNFPENDKYIYFDEITGEAKMLVTLEHDAVAGQTTVRQVEYIE